MLCASIAISWVKWRCGVSDTKAIRMEYWVCLGLLCKSVVSSVEFTLKLVGIIQD